MKDARLTRPKDKFFAEMNQQFIGLTFADVKLRSSYSEVDPRTADVHTRFSRHIGLNIPIVSAAMDRVTEHLMARVMAIAGGMGVIHRNLTPEAQAAEVAKVKNFLNALIPSPVCVSQNQTVTEIQNMRKTQSLSFQSFPVINPNGQLVGVITEDCFDFCTNVDSTAGEIMIAQCCSAKEGTSLETAFGTMMRERVKALPLTNEEGFVVGMYVWSDVQPIVTKSRANYNLDGSGRLRVAAAVGTGEAELLRAQLLIEAGVDAIVLDGAHADQYRMYDMLKRLKDTHPNVDVVVGNVSEGDSAERLAKAGADAVKVGQGCGAICLTGDVAGYGRPQLSAVYDCAYRVKGFDIPIIADGGINYSGDITKAIGAGAHSVMLGRLLAGCMEAPGDIVIVNGARLHSYDGMGSPRALRESVACQQRYNQEGMAKDRFVAEGVEALVPATGSVTDVLHQLVGGLRSGMGATGSPDIEALRENAKFTLLTQNGVVETRPHHLTEVLPTEALPSNRGVGVDHDG